MGCHLGGKATVTTIYGLGRPLRAGASEGDPEPGVFGSDRKNKYALYVWGDCMYEMYRMY